MSPLYTFRPDLVRTYIFAPSKQRAYWYCDRMKINLRDRRVQIFWGGMSPAMCRGFRIEPWDKVIVLEDFWGSPNAFDIRDVMIPAGVDLLDVPITWSVDVA